VRFDPDKGIETDVPSLREKALNEIDWGKSKGMLLFVDQGDSMTGVYTGEGLTTEFLEFVQKSLTELIAQCAQEEADGPILQGSFRKRGSGPAVQG